MIYIWFYTHSQEKVTLFWQQQQSYDRRSSIHDKVFTVVWLGMHWYSYGQIDPKKWARVRRILDYNLMLIQVANQYDLHQCSDIKIIYASMPFNNERINWQSED